MDTSRLDVRTITQRLTVELRSADGCPVPVLVDLGYDSRDPFALTTSFLLGAGPVRWTFARELLADGLVQPSGDGDVHVWPCLNDRGAAIVTIELCSPHGDALVEMRFADAVDIVDRMHAAVPAGQESDHLDLDGMITAINIAESL